MRKTNKLIVLKEKYNLKCIGRIKNNDVYCLKRNRWISVNYCLTICIPTGKYKNKNNKK